MSYRDRGEIELKTLSPERREQVEDLVRRIGFPLDPETMYGRVLEAALELTGADAGSLVLVDEETRLLNIPLTKGFSEQTVLNLKISVGEGVIGWVVENQKPLIVPDTHEEPRFIAGDIDVRAEMAVPMFLGDHVIGALDVNTMKPNTFSEEDAQALFAFATLMAPRVQNARLFGETQQRAEALDALFEIGKLVSQTLEIDLLLQRIVQRALQLMDARIAALTLLDDTGEMLVTRAVAGARKAYSAKPPLPVRGSLIGQVVLTREPIMVENVQEDPRYRFKDVARQEGLRSLLAVPLMFRDKVLGVLSIYMGHLRVFKRDEIHTMRSLADQAAIAIRNARLYEQMSTLEEQVRRMEKIGTAGEIAIGLAHELRNPLTVVKMLLEGAPHLTPEDRDVIHAEVNRMGRIVEQYLDFAKPEDAAWEVVSLHEVIEDTISLLEHRISRREIEVVTQFDAQPIAVLGNASQLQQVFVNLLLNAMDAMPNGGTITIRTTRLPSTVRVLVQDTGEGIPDRIMERLFEPFNTSKDSGIGLGLSIVHRIVRDHQGYIQVTSDAESGTCFSITLPLAERKDGPEPIRSEGESDR